MIDDVIALAMERIFSEDYQVRFEALTRLYGEEGLKRIQRSHICVVGLGGVGSWVVEALVRSGVGRISLVDYDEVCISNSNRQIHAMSETVGQFKSQVLAQRAQKINPEVSVIQHQCFFSEKSQEAILSEPYDYIIDAIDDVKNKCLLLAECRQRGFKIITVGGSGGRRDPSKIKVKDLSRTHGDRLLQKTRKKLRQDFAFPKGDKKLGIPCVFSDEVPYFPDGQGCVNQGMGHHPGRAMDCATGFGSSVSVTGTFGFFVSSYVLNEIAMY